jgi:hypothetical protein
MRVSIVAREAQAGMQASEQRQRAKAMDNKRE